MKIGIFGGTFNPIHLGHLINAQFIKEEFFLDKIIFIPSKYPVHKDLEGEIPADARFKLITAAIENNPAFEASHIEIDREMPSYTIITVKEIMKLYPGSELYLIVGSDAFNEINTWMEYKELINLVAIIVMARKGELSYNNDIIAAAKSVLFAHNPIIEISSTDIRRRIKNGLPFEYLVPGKVKDSILSMRLYKN